MTWDAKLIFVISSRILDTTLNGFHTIPHLINLLAHHFFTVLRLLDNWHFFSLLLFLVFLLISV